MDTSSKLFEGVSPSTICWMSHNDYIETAAPGFTISAHTANCPVAAVECPEKKLYAVQFHPEVLHTQEGTKMLANFVTTSAAAPATGAWTALWSAPSRPPWRPGGQRQGAVRPERRRGSLGGCRACWPKPWASSSPACLWTTACCAKTRATRSAGRIWSRRFLRPELCPRQRAVSGSTQAGGCGRPGKKAQDHWRRVHPGV